MHWTPFLEISSLLCLCALTGILASLLRIPLILAFLTGGLLAGPSIFNLISVHSPVEVFSQFGICILLFFVGTKLDTKMIKNSGFFLSFLGFTQVFLSFSLGFLLSVFLGKSPDDSIYLAAAMTFSSTVLIIKLLSDQDQLEETHAQISVTILMIQDIFAILMMIFLSSKAQSYNEANFSLFLGAPALLCLALLSANWIRALCKRLENSGEILVLFALSWAVLLSSFGEILSLSKEAGAFLAGISFSSVQNNLLKTRLSAIRDFFLLFFFVELGAMVEIQAFHPEISTPLLFSLFVLIIKPLITFFILKTGKLSNRTAFFSSISLGQISEFSLILAALGLSLDEIQEKTAMNITLIAIFTFFASTFMITFKESLYRFFFLLPEEFLNTFRTWKNHNLKTAKKAEVMQIPELSKNKSEKIKKSA